MNKIEEWNRHVWKLNIYERKIQESFEKGLISKKENKKVKKIIQIALEKIWDSHPDQNPLGKDFLKKYFN